MNQEKSDQARIVAEQFHEIWLTDTSGYDELVNKMADPSFVVRDEATINLVNRAVMTNRYILEHYPKGSTVIDAACGNGFNSVYLAAQGYRVFGFDVAPSAIARSQELASRVGVRGEMFTCGDHSVLQGYAAQSADVVCALGFMRYLETDIRDSVYHEAARILKPNGCFIVSNDNDLFDMFSLNNESLAFWNDLVVGFSDAEQLLEGKSLRAVLEENIQVPQRQYSRRSVSRHIKKYSANPLTYGEVMRPYGFRLDKVVYPDAHLLPPFVEALVNKDALEVMKGIICLRRAENDWRAMFMGFEFLSFLRRL